MEVTRPSRQRSAPVVALLLALVLVLSLAGAPAARASAPAAERADRTPAALLPPSFPAAAIPKSPDFTNASCAPDAFDATAPCETATRQALDHARALEGLGPIFLPTNYDSLTRAEQLFMVIDVERVDRGLPAMPGLVTSLDELSATAAGNVADPAPPAGDPWRQYGAVWAGGEATALGTVYDWLYFDGVGGDAIGCAKAGDDGCWVHRQALLSSYEADPATMGAGVVLGSYQGRSLPEYAALLLGHTSGAKATYAFTWAQEQPYLTPAPAVTSLSETRGPAAGGTTVTLAGTRLNKVTSVTFGAAGAGTGLSAATNGTQLSIVSPPSADLGAVTVAIHSTQGTTDAGSFTYLASPPSAPTKVAVSSSGTSGVTLFWSPPIADGGSAIGGYTVQTLAGGVVQATSQVQASPFVVPDLTNGVAYTFTVAADDSAGDPGPPVALPTVVPPFASASAFVKRQYSDLLGVAPTATQLSSGIASLTTARAPAALVASLRRSSDATNDVDPVTRMWFAYFLRPPDAGGFAYWVGRRRAGMSLNAISSSFAASKEFANKYGSLSNAAFVDLIYLNVLQRAGDAAGIAYWTGQLDAHRDNRGQVMTGFSEAAEYKRKMQPSVDVAATWISLLGAAPSTDELSRWATDLGSGQVTLTDLAASVLATTAYAARVG